MATKAITPFLTGGALVTAALAFAYTRRPRAHARPRFRQWRRRGPFLALDLDPLGPDEALARILACAARFKPTPHGEGEALAGAGATWPFLEALDASATTEADGLSTRSRSTRLASMDPGEPFFDPDGTSEELETPPTDRDPATVGDPGGFGTDLPVERFEETDDAIAPEDLGTEWLERSPSPR